jgi:hypothetical protein
VHKVQYATAAVHKLHGMSVGRSLPAHSSESVINDCTWWPAAVEDGHPCWTGDQIQCCGETPAWLCGCSRPGRLPQAKCRRLTYACVQQVADIKRTNSLLSDSAMFARDTLLIPTRPLPMGCVHAVAQHAGNEKQTRAGAVPNMLPYTIDLWSACCRNEYSAWAGLIVTQYGQVSRNLQDRPTLGYAGSGAPDDPSQTAIAQLRAHYGLSPATSPTATAGMPAAPSCVVPASCRRHLCTRHAGCP